MSESSEESQRSGAQRSGSGRRDRLEHVDRHVASTVKKMVRDLQDLALAAEDEAVGQLLAATARIDGETTQSGILATLLEEGQRFASRTAFFLTRPGEIRGWAGRGFPAVERAHINYGDDSVWARLASQPGTVGLNAEESAAVCDSLGGSAGGPGVLIPFSLRGQLSGVVYADRLEGEGSLGISSLQLLTHLAAQTVETAALRGGGSSPTLRMGSEAAPEAETAATSSTAAHAAAVAAAATLAAAAVQAAPAKEEVPVVAEASEPESPPAAGEELPSEPPAEVESVDPEVAEVESIEVEEAEVESVDLEEVEVEAVEVEEAVDLEEAEAVDFEMVRTEVEEDIEAADDIEAELEPEPELEDTSDLWAVEEEEEATFVGPAVVEEPVVEEPVVEEPVAEEPGMPQPPGMVPPEVGQETVRLDIAALQGQMPGVPVDPAAEAETAKVPQWEVDAAPEVASQEFELEPEEEPAAPAVELEPELSEPVTTPMARPDFSEDATFINPPREQSPMAGGYVPPAPESSEVTPPADMAPPTEVTPPTEVAPPTEVTPPPSSGFAAPPAPKADGTNQVVPPTDIQGPGSAFGATSDDEVMTAGEEALHEEARRLARLLVSEIKLYNEEIIEEGRRSGNIYDRLKDDIDRSRQMYEERIDPRLLESGKDYFRQELVQRLAGGDEKLLGY